MIRTSATAYKGVMPRVAAVLCLTLLLAGCGGDSRDRAARSAAVASPESVVRGWADDLRRGDVDGATARFAVPAIVANGTPEIRLTTRRQIRVFNETLPCGGRVTETERHHGVIIATFELTDRPGSKCDGSGNRAKAAFEVRGGKIVRWLRVPVGGGGPAPRGDLV